ncbi:hypothetical protein V7112_15525 [Bacillus sp. JJ1566]|uniref:hypothetical protein n=1 Tax=Bacillus sp. JJ1566 TaxID=3122961 RepID=UPI003000EE7F
MLKSRLKVLVTVGSFLGIAGVLLLFFNANLGLAMGENWLVSKGGADTALYLLVIELYSNSFLATGSILFGVGLLTVLLAYYNLIKIEN